jgi:urate oxidase
LYLFLHQLATAFFNTIRHLTGRQVFWTGTIFSVREEKGRKNNTESLFDCSLNPNRPFAVKKFQKIEAEQLGYFVGSAYLATYFWALFNFDQVSL